MAPYKIQTIFHFQFSILKKAPGIFQCPVRGRPDEQAAGPRGKRRGGLARARHDLAHGLF
jgi:hypothetical protein